MLSTVFIFSYNSHIYKFKELVHAFFNIYKKEPSESKVRFRRYDFRKC